MSAPKHIVGCLSMMRTGSSALAAALRAASFPDAVHIHFLGENATPRPFPVTPQILSATALLAEADAGFTLVTCVRDPIARWISQAFHNAETRRARTGIDIVANGEAFLAWMDAKDGLDYSTDWFDESLRATFGFEFRRHPFHRERRSIRYEAERLRLLVLRQEDPQPGKEIELGWLVGRPKVVIPVVNDGRSRHYPEAYRSFVATFRAPAPWVDAFYETEVARHFYSLDERTAFRIRWSRR